MLRGESNAVTSKAAARTVSVALVLHLLQTLAFVSLVDCLIFKQYFLQGKKEGTCLENVLVSTSMINLAYAAFSFKAS